MSFSDILAQLAQGLVYTVWVTLICSATGMAVGLAVAGLRRVGSAGWK
ncbi:MAG: amino acid ABC transporter permease, partial [Verrucomicrobia bacterium]|nr:amino acid ABC transporter permease [Verrucomicrobiota bacterium]